MRNNSGSSSLATMFTVFAAVSFVLLFSNISQYVSSRGAVQKSADRAARCVAATEAGCVKEEFTGSAPSSLWFGSPAIEQVSVYAQSGEYSVNIPHTTYTGTVSRSQVRSELRSVGWGEWELPVTRVVGLLNSWALLEAHVQVSIVSTIDDSPIICELNKKEEIPFGLDFNTPATYFDPRWCGDLDALNLALTASKCTNNLPHDLSSYKLSDQKDWGTHCSIVLPGVKFVDAKPVFTNQQPWLLLGGEAVCDGEPTYDSDLSVDLRNINRPSANVGDQDKPFPMTVARQYVIIDVVSCDSPENIKQKVEGLFPANSDATVLADFLGATREISGSNFSEYDSSARTIDEEGNYSLFLSAPDPETANVALPAEYNWTFLRWVRQVERVDEAGNALAVGASGAERTVLNRKLCGWYDLESAQNSNLSGIENARALPEAIKVVFDDGSCAASRPSEQQPTFTCLNRFSSPPQGTLDACRGWEAEKSLREEGYRAEQARAANINSTLPGLQQLVDKELGFDTSVLAEWNTEPIDVVWQNALVVDEEVASSYQKDIDPIRLKVATADTATRNPREPRGSAWIAALKTQGAESDLGWQQFIKNPQIEVEQGESFEESFESLHPFRFATEDSYLPVVVASEGGSYDFDLDCSEESQCGQEAVSLENRLWNLVRQEYELKGYESALPALAEIQFEIERSSGSFYKELGTFHPSELASVRQALPACSAVQTSCRRVEDPKAPLEFAGYGQQPPARCSQGELVNCFAAVDVKQLEQLPISKTVDKELAKKAALKEVVQLFPGSQLAKNCSKPRCLAVDIEEDAEQVQVTSRYAMPLQFPLNAILQKEYILVEAVVSQPLEVTLAGN